MHASEKEYLDGMFGVKNILARTALELPDPELQILGIDPFKRISKKFSMFSAGLLRNHISSFTSAICVICNLKPTALIPEL